MTPCDQKKIASPLNKGGQNAFPSFVKEGSIRRGRIGGGQQCTIPNYGHNLRRPNAHFCAGGTLASGGDSVPLKGKRRATLT